MNRPQALHPIWLQPAPEHEPSYTLDRQIAEARESMGEARWQQVMREWDDDTTPAALGRERD